MSENNTNQINKKIEIPKLRLWLIWLFLFVIPVLASVVVFNYYTQEYYYFTNTNLISTSFETIRRYNASVIPENFMEQRINIIRQLDSTLSYKDLNKEIDKILCGNTLFTIFFDENIDKLTIEKVDNTDLPINIPINITKMNIKKLLTSYHSLIQKTEENNDEKTQEKNTLIFNEAQNQLGIILQKMLKTMTTVTISSNKIAKNYSIIYGGELYFIFCEFDKPSKNNIGFLAVMRGRDFSFHKMLEILHKDYPDIKIIFREIDINKSTENQEKFYSGIKNTPTGISIIAPVSIKFVRHVIHGGSDEIIEKYNKLLPMLEYRIPIEKYYADIKDKEKKLNYSALIIILLSAICFLHITLFGINEKLSFKKKIVSLIMISSFFPFSLFTIGIYTINEYNRFIKQTSIQQHAETELQLASQELKQFFTDLESKVSFYNLTISEYLTDKQLYPSTLLNYLDKIKDEIPITSELILMDPVPDNLKAICEGNSILLKIPERTSKELLEEEKDAVTKIVPQVILACAKENSSSEDIKRNRMDIYQVYNTEIEITEINDWLVYDGKFREINKSMVPVWFICSQLHSKKDHSVIGLFLARFEPKSLLKAFIPNSTIFKKNFKETEDDDYKIYYAFLPIKNSGSANIWNGSGSLSPEDQSLVLKTPQSEIVKINNKTIIKKRNQKIPHLAVALIKESDNYYKELFLLKVLTYVLAYLSLIFYFANKLLDIMFVEPVMLLASNANAIARGSDKWDTEINTGDEFEDLNKDFKELVIGLKERNILKSYVSEDAFSDIEENESSKLLPGGEYLDATIVFAAIKDYEQITKELKPEEIIALLSSYISIGEECAKNHSGSLDKILGDTIMLVFRENEIKGSHGLRAAKAALELVERSKIVGLPGLYTGIASGRVISGKIGSYYGKLDFTVIGNPVNLAARFKAEAKKGTENTGIIISGITIGLLNGRGNVKFLRRCSIKGKARKYNIYELLSLRS